MRFDMKWIPTVFGVLLFLMGTVWILQGTGVFPVGFMANDMKYTYIGIVVDLFAIGLIVFTSRGRKKVPPAE
jgi:vacuolar-type H+-ATPase subunit I/STV1